MMPNQMFWMWMAIAVCGIAIACLLSVRTKINITPPPANTVAKFIAREWLILIAILICALVAGATLKEDKIFFLVIGGAYFSRSIWWAAKKALEQEEQPPSNN